MSLETTRATVLVVEDEALLLLSISCELQAAGYTVLEAGNADEAVDLLVRHPEIRVMFTDIDMPGSMDGLRLTAVVRNRWPPVRAILTSGKHLQALEHLPDGRFLPKPYTTSGVLAAIESALT